MKNVLVFPCGSEIGLEINRALASSKHFAMFGASSVDDHGRFVYANYIPGVPFIDKPEFLSKINEVVRSHNIDFIVPAHDSAVLKMSENQNFIDATVVTSCASTCRVCRSKAATYEFFRELLATPRVYPRTADMEFPIFLKPDVGQGTKGTYRADCHEDVEFYTKKDPSLLALEYLPGKEYTVDCFTDRNRSLLFAEGRERRRISNGISVNSTRVKDVRFREMAQIINRTLALQGAWFYQVKERSDGDLVLMEIAPRIAGTMGLFRALGVNFVELSLFDRMGVPVRILPNECTLEIDRALFARYDCDLDYECIYLDFDDTVVVNGRVNTTVMALIYQSRNLGKAVRLISRSRENIYDKLCRFAICEGLFDEIVVLDEGARKSDYITNTNCVFIDDSFAERQDVADRLHVPVFALDAIEALLLWKV